MSALELANHLFSLLNFLRDALSTVHANIEVCRELESRLHVLRSLTDKSGTSPAGNELQLASAFIRQYEEKNFLLKLFCCYSGTIFTTATCMVYLSP